MKNLSTTSHNRGYQGSKKTLSGRKRVIGQNNRVLWEDKIRVEKPRLILPRKRNQEPSGRQGTVSWRKRQKEGGCEFKREEDVQYAVA